MSASNECDHTSSPRSMSISRSVRGDEIGEHEPPTVRVELADTVHGGDGQAFPQLARRRIVEADRGFRQSDGDAATIGGEMEETLAVFHHLPGRPAAADVPEDRRHPRPRTA